MLARLALLLLAVPLGQLGLTLATDVADVRAARAEPACLGRRDEQWWQALDRPQAVAADVVDAWQ